MAVTKTKVPSKLCTRCNRVLPLNDFYVNKGWADQLYRDVWCRECVADYCHDSETLQQYCFENNRRWDDGIFDSAAKKAQTLLASNAEYIDPKTTAKRKDEIFGKAAARAFFSIMNMPNFYRYINNANKITDTEPIPELDSESEDKKDKKDKDKIKKPLSYNKKWRGYFTDEQIEQLEDIYSQYEEDFVLDNVNIRDYAKKVAKASLNADIAEDRMRRGEISASDYKEAQKIFDDQSKSSNFAACRRKPGESSGLGSLGEIILRLEVGGALNTNGFTFPEDDVDKIINDFRHTLIAVGSEGKLQ